jgi:hypothetical protein
MKLKLQYYGQKLLNLWKKMVTKKRPAIITSPTSIPSGLAVKTDSGVYWVKDNKRFKLISDRAAKSWSFTTVEATDQAIVAMKVLGKLGFRDGTLIKNIADGKIYLISQNKRRHIIDPDSFIKFGLDRSKVVEVSESETNMHDLGENL